MTEAVIAAAITGVCAIIAEIIITARSTRELYAKLDKRSELADAELESHLEVLKTYIDGQLVVIRNETSELRRAVEKHNGVVERMYSLESELNVQKEKLRVLENK